MKTLTDIITEKLILNKSNAKQEYHYHPKDEDELKILLQQLLKERSKDANLNDIDTSAITNMSWLFYNLDPHEIDISEWNVSNVKNMSGMFYDCKKFDCDLSSWDVSNVRKMYAMFAKCRNFNSDLSSWDVSNVEDMYAMFAGCDKLEKIPKWYVQ